MKEASAKINEAKRSIEKLGDYKKREDDSYKVSTVGEQGNKQIAIIDRLADAFDRAQARSILGGQKEQRDVAKIVKALKTVEDDGGSPAPRPTPRPAPPPGPAPHP